MRPPLFLGLDLGTTAVKGVLSEADGNVVARARFDRPASFPQPGWVEMDAERDWWQASLRVIRDLLSQVPERTRDILSIGVCGMVPCLCLLDGNSTALRPAILYSDNRALAELDRANAQTGQALTAEAATPKLLWIKRHEPAVYAQVKQAVSAHQYVIQRLTGRTCMDYDTASILGGIFRFASKTYDRDALHALDLPLSIWPDLLPAPAAAGGVTAAAAAASGLAEGTIVLAGTGDTFPSIIGCGAVDAGDAMIAIGTTGLLTLTLRPLVESVMGPHFDDGSGRASIGWAANVLSAGQLASWWTGQQDPDLAQGMARLEAEAARIPPGAEGLTALPHWLGRRTPLPNPDLRGALIGLTPRHTSAHIYRALLEAFAFNLLQGFEPIRDLTLRVVATGGGASSPLWRQILADVLGVEIGFDAQSSGALGMAYLAAWATGAVHEFDTVKQSWLRAETRSLPDAQAAAAYKAAYQSYQVFERALEEGYGRLKA